MKNKLKILLSISIILMANSSVLASNKFPREEVFEIINLEPNIEAIRVERYKMKHHNEVLEMLQNLDNQDKTFLALNSKWDVIKNNLNNARHIYVALFGEKVIGYLRESGRPEGYSLLEEIVVDRQYRKKGVASKLLETYLSEFKGFYAKTNSKNVSMHHLLGKYGFDIIKKGVRIYEWKK